MSDLSEFTRLMSRQPGPKCATGLALKALTPAKRSKLQEALDEPRITGMAIARWLKQNGHQVSDVSVRRHRRGDCSCDRSE